jgi:hypothetical protein
LVFGSAGPGYLHAPAAWFLGRLICLKDC